MRFSRRSAGLIACVLACACTRVRAQVVVAWGNGNASWNVGTNWSGGSAPGTTEGASVGGGAASVDNPTSITTLTLSGGNIGGTATLTVTGANSTWTGGSMNGAGTVKFASGASLAISGSNDHDLVSRTLLNEGTITWTQGWLRGGNGSTITNAAGATFNTTANGYSLYNPVGGSFTFTNNGTFNRSGSGNTQVDIPFDSGGTVNVSGGRLTLHGGGTGSGTFAVSGTGSELLIDNGYTLTNGATLSGSVRFTGGTLTAGGTVNVNGLSFEGGGLAGTQTFTGGAISWTGGTWNGAGDTTTLAGSTTLNIGNGADHDINNRTLLNQGTINWTAGYIRGGQGSNFTNAAGATFNDLNASGYTVYNPWGGSFTFTNNGSYVRNATNTTAFDVPFNNNGLVDLKQGNIEFRAGGTVGATGNITAAADTNVFFRTDHTIASGATLTGAGNYWLTAGTLTVPGTLTAPTFNQTGGTLAGTNTLAGTFNWSSGNWSTSANSSDRTTIASGATLNLNGGSDKDIYGRGVTNQGTVNWNAGYIRGGQGSGFTNAAGATFNDLNASGYTVYNPWGGSFTFTNNGSYVRNATNTTAFDVPFDNNGAVNLQSGELQFRAGGTMSATGTITAAEGTRVVFTTNYTIADGSSLLGAGEYRLTGGTLNVPGTLTVGTFNQTGGTLGGTNTIKGTYNWSGGNWSTDANSTFTTTIGAGSTLNLNTGTDKDIYGRGVVNNGTVVWNSGYIRGGQGSGFVNGTGATFDDRNASSYTMYNPWGGAFSFTNNGTYTRNAGGTTSFDIPFNNNGTITLAQGDLQFRAGGTMSDTSSITAASGTNVYFTTSYTLANGSSLAGAGTYWLTGGTLSVPGTLNVTTLNQTSGTLGGTNTLQGVYNWSGGNWSAAANSGETTTIAAGATVNLNTGSDKDIYGRGVTNNGTVNWNSGYFRGGQGSSFINAAGATFNDLNSGSYSVHNPWGGTFVFTNNGSYVRNTTGTTYFDAPFDNNGTVELKKGDLQFRAGGTMSAAGSMAAAAGTNIYFTNNYTIANGASLTGLGNYWLTNGSLALTGTVNVGTFTQTGGTLAGTNTINGTFNWTGGNWSVDATGPQTTIGAGAALNLTGGSDKDFYARAIVNRGTTTWTAGYLRGGNGSSFTNASGATFNDQNASGYTVHNPWGGAFVFTNSGSYVRNAGGTTYFDTTFDNTGTVSLLQGSLQLRAGGTMSATSIVNAAADTTLYISSNYTVLDGAQFTGNGGFWFTGGTLTLNGVLTASNFNWASGNWNTAATDATTTIGATTTLNLVTGGDKDFDRRHLVNQGTVNWNTGYVRAGNGATFVNAAGGTFNDLNGSGYSIHNPFGGSFVFTNDGTYVRNAAGTTYFDTTFNNNGTLNLQQGTMLLRAGGAMSGTSVVNAATGTNLYFISDYSLLDGAQLNGAGTYWQTGGTLSIQTLRATTFNWDSGNWNSATAATTTIASGTTLNLTSGNDKDFAGRAIVNQGVVNWNAGYIRGGNGSAFTNAAGATFNDQNASGYSIHNPFGGTFTFTNNGNYVRNVGNVTYFDAPFNNTGTVDLQLGGILVRAGGTMSASSVVNAAAGTNFYFTNNYTLQNGAQLNGAGTFWQTGGTLTADVLRASNFNWESGNWNSASPFTTTIASGTRLNLTSGNDKDFSGRAIVNQGIVTWKAGYIRGGNGSSFTNASGGVFNDENASGYSVHNPFGGSFTFTNSGTYDKKTTGTTTFSVGFTNSNGSILVNGGTLRFSAGFTHTGGTLQLSNNAVAQFDQGLSFPAGTLGGSGTLIGNVSSGGQLAPGTPTGTLGITGNLTLLATSTLLIELGGTGQGTGFDFVNVSGNGVLGGNLAVSFLNGFNASVSPTATFTVLTAGGTGGLTGAFANVASGQRLNTFDGTGSFLVSYGAGSTLGANSVVLSNFVAVPEPSTYALLGLGGAALLVRRRRRQTNS